LLFVAFFIASLVLGGMLATSRPPMPDAPAAQTARYYDDGGRSVLARDPEARDTWAHDPGQ
jgi:hypothetical protein